jgi:hypothetical protein
MNSKKQKLKKSLIELAVKDQFVPGICNFCNRWCERCPKAHKCLSFAYAQEIKGVGLELNTNSANDTFWNILKQQTIIETPESRKKELPLSDLEGFAIDYGKEVNNWIDTNKTLFEKTANQQSLSDTQEITFSEALEVLSWHSEFIGSKITRSKKELNERNNQDTSDKTNPYRDNVGSAKIAIIACHHSKAALSILLFDLPNYESKIKSFIASLSLIEDGILELFPKAMNFKRPGLDE